MRSRRGERTDVETLESLTKSLIIVCFEGRSQSLVTIIDGFTDIWWFWKGEGLANRTSVVHRSFAPSSFLGGGDGWSRVGGVGQKPRISRSVC